MQPGVRREECPDSSCHFAVWPDTAVIQAEPEWTRWSMFCRSLAPIEVRRRLQVKTRPPLYLNSIDPTFTSTAWVF
jgi:hypothetical protein